ncbi:unnamed protein product, partial [Adineta steineri]
MVLGTWFWWPMVLMPMVFACNEAYKSIEILHCNVCPGGEWWLAHLAPTWSVLVK